MASASSAAPTTGKRSRVQEPAALSEAEVPALLASQASAKDESAFADSLSSAPAELQEAYSRLFGDSFTKSISGKLVDAVESRVEKVARRVAGGVKSVVSALTHAASAPGEGAPAGKTLVIKDASAAGFEWVDTTAVYDAITEAKELCECPSAKINAYCG